MASPGIITGQSENCGHFGLMATPERFFVGVNRVHLSLVWGQAWWGDGA
jgi:hypothetical protein